MPGAAPSTGVGAAGRASIAARTLRRDRWWLPPLVTALGLVAWILYATVRAASQRYYWVADYHYLTPFASPCLSTSCAPGSSHFGTPFGDFPPLVPYAILTLPFLLLFRLTCYYYRKAYYRSFWLSPPACAVAEPHASYTGETRFPLILQNVHRYFFYAAGLISVINTYDAIVAFHGKGGGFGFGLGNVVLVANVASAVGLHALVPLLPQHRRRPAQPLLQAPGALPAVAARCRGSTATTWDWPGSPWRRWW